MYLMLYQIYGHITVRNRYPRLTPLSLAGAWTHVGRHPTASIPRPGNLSSSAPSSHGIMASSAEQSNGGQGRAASVSAASENSQTAQEYAHIPIVRGGC